MTTLIQPIPVPAHYVGKVVSKGNSKVVRLDANFFAAHPEFNGDVGVTVLAYGQVLLSAKSTRRRKAQEDAVDPVMLGFLRHLTKGMTDHPDWIAPANRAQLRRIGKLVAGINTI